MIKMKSYKMVLNFLIVFQGNINVITIIILLELCLQGGLLFWVTILPLHVFFKSTLLFIVKLVSKFVLVKNPQF